jgi:hypothetical protein
LQYKFLDCFSYCFAGLRECGAGGGLGGCGKGGLRGCAAGEDEDSYGVGHEHHEDFFNGVWREENFYGLGQEDPDTASLGGATWSPLL